MTNTGNAVFSFATASRIAMFDSLKQLTNEPDATLINVSGKHSTGLQVISELGVLGGVIFVVLIALSGVTFIREIRGVQSVNEMLVTTFLASLFVSVCVADQIYGNFFMALAFWLLIGISASIRGDSCLRNRVNV